MLKQTVAMITGAGSGLGLATVQRFVMQRAKALIADLPTLKSRATSEQLGPSVVFSATDVRSESDVQTAVNLSKQIFGKLNVVVNCAGIAEAHTTFNFNNNLPHKLEIFTNILMINTVGTFNVIRLAVGLMGENEPNEDGERGVIVNIASIVAYDGPIELAAYSASKAAVVGMTLPIARELSAQGIRVVTVAPGPFDTAMYQIVPEKYRNFIAKSIPFPSRLGNPDEYAKFVQAIV